MTDGSLALTLLRAVISLALVLGLLVFTMRMLARRGGFAAVSQVRLDIEVLGRRQLSRTASVQVVRVAGRTLVLGVTDSEVSVLTHLSSSDLPADEDAGEADVDDGTPTPASAALLHALRRQGQVGNLIADAQSRRRGGRHRGGSRV